MDAFDMPQIDEAHRQNGELYHEFLRANRLSVGKELIPMVRDGAAALSK